MQFQTNNLGRGDFSKSQVTSIISLYIFTFGTLLLGLSAYLFFEATGLVSLTLSNWSGQGFFWSMITLFLSIFLLFIPIEFFGSYNIMNRAFKELLINIVTVIIVSLFSLFIFQMLLNGENLFINEYLKLARAASFSGFITVPLVLFLMHNLSKKISFLNNYAYSIVLLIWVLSSQLFI